MDLDSGITPYPRTSWVQDLDIVAYCSFSLFDVTSSYNLLILSSLTYQYTKSAYLDIPLTASFFLSLFSVPLDRVAPALSDSMKYLKDQVFLAIPLKKTLRIPACWWTPTSSSLSSASQYNNALHHITWHFPCFISLLLSVLTTWVCTFR